MNMAVCLIYVIRAKKASDTEKSEDTRTYINLIICEDRETRNSVDTG